MQKFYIRGIALAAGAAALLSPLAAHAQGNPGFETPSIGGGFQLFNTASTIGAWTVVSGNVEVIRTFWQPHGGAQSIDLSGGTAGAIEQTLTTIPNNIYQITFWMAGNPTGGAAIKNLQLDFGANSANHSFDTTGFTRPNMGWTLKSSTFTATGNSTVLRFSSLSGANSFGPALDDVQVSDLGPSNGGGVAAPEPATLALAGLGLLPLGMLLRRRK